MGSSGTQGPASLVGRIIEGYRLERVLGKGATGIVFLGRRADGEPALIEQTRVAAIELPVEAAIKVLVLPWQLDDDERAEFRRRFLREADTLRRLQHPHILPIITYGEDAVTDSPYMILPYLSGGTLQGRLANHTQPLPLAEVERLLGQIANAVDYAHSRGVVHRDIKPGNILLDAQGQAFLSDFSIARMMVDATTRLTRTGLALGTPMYMAPEALAGQEGVSPAADIYSLGMVAYEMVVGPRANATNTPPPPRTLRTDLPEPAEAAILRALAPDPAQRFPTAAAFAQAFALGLQGQWSAGLMTQRDTSGAQRAASQATTQIAPASQPTQRISGGRRLGVLGAAVALLLVVACVAAAIFALPGQPLLAMFQSHTPTVGALATTTLAQTAAPTGSHTPGAKATATTKKGATAAPVGGSTPASATATAKPAATTGPTNTKYGDGSDGAVTISATTTFYPLDATCYGSAGSKTLFFSGGSNSLAGATGKPILIHQSQGSGAGTWMRTTVTSASGGTSGTLTLLDPLNASYTSGAQVIVLYEYTNITVNSGASWIVKPWNGATGGILAFLAKGTVTINGSVAADGWDGAGSSLSHTNGGGFRGGPYVGTNTHQAGFQGEGTSGDGVRSTSANGNAGGAGGYASSDNSQAAGGGGSNGTQGTAGANYGNAAGGAAGYTSGNSNLTVMTFGGGGGSGGSSDNSGGGVGGNGGGIIFISATTVNLNGQISARGGNGGPNVVGNNSPGGGGGAGGSVLIYAGGGSINTSLINVSGGTGGSSSGSHGPGGNGGNGRIYVG